MILDLSPIAVDSKNKMTAVICTGRGDVGNTFCLMDLSAKTQFSLISHFIKLCRCGSFLESRHIFGLAYPLK